MDPGSHSVFTLDQSVGTLPAKGSLTLRLRFRPHHPIAHHKRAACLILHRVCLHVLYKFGLSPKWTSTYSYSTDRVSTYIKQFRPYYCPRLHWLPITHLHWLPISQKIIPSHIPHFTSLRFYNLTNQLGLACPPNVCAKDQINIRGGISFSGIDLKLGHVFPKGLRDSLPPPI